MSQEITAALGGEAAEKLLGKRSDFSPKSHTFAAVDRMRFIKAGSWLNDGKYVDVVQPFKAKCTDTRQVFFRLF